MKNNARSKNLFYGFMLAGCFLAMGIVDQDAVKDAETEAARTEWIAEMNARQAQQRDEAMQPNYVSSPAFVGKPNYDKQFAALRAEYESRKVSK